MVLHVVLPEDSKEQRIYFHANMVEKSFPGKSRSDQPEQTEVGVKKIKVTHYNPNKSLREQKTNVDLHH